VLIYPKETPEEKERIKNNFKTLFLGNTIDFEEQDIADFLTDKSLIWDW
jgi:hypothetical protein